MTLSSNPEIEELKKRITELENRVEQLYDHLVSAIDYIDSDPQSSLTKSRIVLEKMVYAIYCQEMASPPKVNMIGNMLSDKEFVCKIPRRIIARMNSIREMANLGPHGGEVDSEDAIRTIRDLMDVMEWYIGDYSPIPIRKQTTLTALGKAETIEILPRLLEQYPEYIGEDVASVKFGQSGKHCFLEVTYANKIRELVDEKITRQDLGIIIDVDEEKQIARPFFNPNDPIKFNAEIFVSEFEGVWPAIIL